MEVIANSRSKVYEFINQFEKQIKLSWSAAVKLERVVSSTVLIQFKLGLTHIASTFERDPTSGV